MRSNVDQVGRSSTDGRTGGMRDRRCHVRRIWIMPRLNFGQRLGVGRNCGTTVVGISTPVRSTDSPTGDSICAIAISSRKSRCSRLVHARRCRKLSTAACNFMAAPDSSSVHRSSVWPRDARILTIGGGATEVMLEEVAKRMQCGDCCGLGKPSLPIFPQQGLMCDGAKASTSAPSMVSRSASI